MELPVIVSPVVIDSTPHVATIVDNDVDLKVVVAPPVAPVIAGSGANNLSFVVTLTNPGNTDATNIVIGDLFTLPAGATLTGSTASIGTFSGTNANGTWTVPALAKNGTATLTLNFTADHSVANGAQASAYAAISSATETLVNGADDKDIKTVPISRRGDLSVTVSDLPDPVGAGQQLTYTIVVANSGPSDSTGATVSDLFPAALTGTTWSTWRPQR